MFEFCLKVPVSEENPDGRVCYFIPILIDEHWKFGPPPPDDHLNFRDWRILATIDELAASLSRDRGREIIESVSARLAEADRSLGDAASLSRRAE
jgi:hypothetical protein